MPKGEPQLEKLGEVLKKSLKRLDLSPKLEEYGVWPVWDEIVGATIARNAQPEKIRNGTLFVKVSSSTWMQELQYMKEMISEKLNQSLGKKVVKNIFFVIGKIETRAAKSENQESSAGPSLPEWKLDEEQLRSVKDPEIRRALKKLYTVHSRRGKK